MNRTNFLICVIVLLLSFFSSSFSTTILEEDHAAIIQEIQKQYEVDYAGDVKEELKIRAFSVEKVSPDESAKLSDDTSETDVLNFLPPPDSQGETENLRELKLGEKLSLDDLGPIIINSDGTTRRINNWDKLTKAEQEKTLRVISKRNKKRLEILKKQQEKQEAGENE